MSKFTSNNVRLSNKVNQLVEIFDQKGTKHGLTLDIINVYASGGEIKGQARIYGQKVRVIYCFSGLWRVI
jgi:hypothetical protein